MANLARVLAGITVLSLAAVGTQWASAQEGAAGQAKVGLLVVENTSEVLVLDVQVTDVANLGAFQFVLTFDNRRMDFVSVGEGPFLGSTGREIVCNEPVLSDMAVRFSCVTLRQEPRGPDGSGVLATVRMQPKKSGETDMGLERVQLVAPDASDIEVSAEGLRVTLDVPGSGPPWLLIAVSAAGAVVVLAGVAAAYTWRQGRKRRRID